MHRRLLPTVPHSVPCDAVIIVSPRRIIGGAPSRKVRGCPAPEACAPQMCAAAGIVLALLPDLATPLLGGLLPRRAARWLGRLLQRGLLLLTVVLSLSRTLALVYNYGAPMSIYRALPAVRRILGQGKG